MRASTLSGATLTDSRFPRDAVRPRTLFALSAFVGCVLAWQQVSVSGYQLGASCRTPAFVTTRDFVNVDGTGSVNVSVRPEDFSVATLTCLAHALNRSHPQWGDVSVLIFDSAAIAKSWRPLSGGSSGVRATYTLNRRLKTESLSLHLLRDGADGGSDLDTILDLTKPSARCRFEVQRRCVLAMDGPSQFDDVVLPAGRVTVTARITAAGTVESARVLASASSTSEESVPLQRALIEHLESWRFEPAAMSSEFSVSYRYLVDSEVILADIDIESAGAVTIRANPGITKENLRRLIEKK